MQTTLTRKTFQSPDSSNSSTVQSDKTTLRWLVRSDLENVLELEKRCFEYRWTGEDFAQCLARRNCAGMVAIRDNRIVGFMIYEVSRKRIELLSLAIDPNLTRQGLGSLLVTRLIRKLQTDGRTRISVTVRERNLAAQLFLRQLGFRATSILRQFYEPASEDAYLMQYRLKWTDESGPDSTATSRQASFC